MKATIYYIAVFLLLGMLACEPPAENATDYHHFNIKDFLSEEASQQEYPLTLIKTVSFNEKIDEDTSILKNDTSFLDQFKLLLANDIDKAALYGKYEIDTSWDVYGFGTPDSILLITYKAISDKEQTKKLDITIKHDTIVAVSALNNRSSLINNSETEIHFLLYPERLPIALKQFGNDRLLHIAGNKKTIFREPQTFEISYTFH